MMRSFPHLPAVGQEQGWGWMDAEGMGSPGRVTPLRLLQELLRIRETPCPSLHLACPSAQRNSSLRFSVGVSGPNIYQYKRAVRQSCFPYVSSLTSSLYKGRAEVCRRWGREGQVKGESPGQIRIRELQSWRILGKN